MRRWFRFRNDPKRFKPLVTGHDGINVRYWTVTTETFDGKRLVECFYNWGFAIEQANEWAAEYRAEWVAANMRNAA